MTAVTGEPDLAGDHPPAPAEPNGTGRGQVLTSEDLTAKNSTAKNPAAKDPTAKNPTAKDLAGKGRAAKDRAGKGLTGKGRAARNPAAKDPTAKDLAGKGRAAKDPTGEAPMAKNPAGKGRAAKARRFLGFGVVGVSGFLPNLAVMWLCTDVLRLHYALSAVVAHQVATSWNFALTDRLVFRDRGPGSMLRRYGWFMLAGNADLVVRIPFLAVLVSLAHMNALVASVVVIGAMFLVRFVVADRLIYRLPAPPVGEPG